MKTKINWLILALATLMSSCEQETTIVALDVSATEIYLGSPITSQTCEISSTSNWSATCDAYWIELDKPNGPKGISTLTISTPNIPNEFSQATITLSNEEGKTAHIEVRSNDERCIFYTTTDQQPLDLYNWDWNLIESHTYGIIRFYNPIREIPDDAFEYKVYLASIAIPYGVNVIGEYAFSYCSSLTHINIPESVNSIGESAFYNCSSLTQINIPANVTNIGDHAFYGCSSLTTVFCKPTIPPSLSYDHVPFESEYVRWIFVPAESLNDYKTDYPWSDYSDIIRGYNF